MKKLLLLALALGLLLPCTAQAQRVGAPAPMMSGQTGGAGLLSATPEQAAPKAPMAEGIIAVVNDSIISSGDLRARLALAILSAGLPDSPEVQKKLLAQTLRTLIDEQLQMQEGKRLEITIPDSEIQDAMSRLATDNQIPGGNMAAFLRQHHIPPSTMKAQIKATLTWNRVAMRELRPRIDIGEDEINAEIGRMRANAGKQEYLVSEIFLGVDKPEDEPEVQALAEKLVEQIKGGAVFGSAARQFSQGLGASTGGDIGWIQSGQLAPELDKTLQTLQKGDVAGPLRTADGYHILGIRDMRIVSMGDMKTMAVKLEQIFRPFTPTTEKESLLREAETIRQTVTDCASLKSTLASSFPLWRWQDLGEVKLADAPPWLANKVAPLSEGQASEAMATDRGALMVFVCGRTMPEENVNREAIRSAIGGEKMELLARRQMRDLRKSAFIDVRLK
ncbi:MAG: peptidylprolyl isomerase [Bdellovibrionales bacterium]|jgi:peptidyl-prolyl cis-trans isomerase SurA